MCGPLTVDRVLAPGPHLKAIRSLVTTSEGDNMRVTRYRFYGQFETDESVLLLYFGSFLLRIEKARCDRRFMCYSAVRFSCKQKVIDALFSLFAKTVSSSLT